ncbi:hypothetical protein DL770_000474 [Monosporascus sp. CRB-9-2]|nr:hypothetical protein DL770_000474 [Monosporascus sp. CRB-9-2]
MREFMDYIQSAFYAGTGWNRDNSYSSLNATSDALLSFPTPRGLRLTLSSLATPQFATSYQLGTVGVVDGSISYLYSSVPLHRAIAQSDRIPLPDLLKSYRPLSDLARTAYIRHGWDGGARAKKETLAYGRLYLPMSMLEALVVRRVSPALQWQVSAVSNQTLRNGGTVLSMVQYDVGRYGIEGLASSDGGLLGVRGLYNFGGDVAELETSKEKKVQDEGNVATHSERDRIHGRFSTGAELYYGTLNKSGGTSLGIRFATIPPHKGTPLTATMTINPLMGNISWTYAVMAGSYCSLATKLSFNVYSYESDWAVGMELWRKKGASAVSVEEEVTTALPRKPERSFQAKMEWRLDDAMPEPDSHGGIAGSMVVHEPIKKEVPLEPTKKEVDPEPINNEMAPEPIKKEMSLEPIKKERSFQAKMEWRLDDPEEDKDEDQYSGVLKARLDQHLRLGLLWEGRAKSLLFSLGSGIDLRRLDSPFRTLGLEVQFSS